LKSVGVRELKRSLSSFLRHAQSGERILVTDRKKPVAVIAAVDNLQQDEMIRQLVDAGVTYWTGGKPRGTIPRVRSRKSVSEAILEYRR
jgi:prevent-host-death family protein